MRKRLFPAAVVISAVVSGAVLAGVAAGPKFFRDDPITRDVETEDAKDVRPATLSQLYDFAENSFLGAGEESDVRAQNINTIEEVPDSSWFTNRLGREIWTPERLVKGPDTSTAPAGTRTIISGKMEGIAPGFTIRDGTGQIYFIKFDPPGWRAMATGVDTPGSAYIHSCTRAICPLPSRSRRKDRGRM